LERDLDAELFDRTRRPPSLTPLGRRVADQARDVLKAQARLVEICRGEDALAGDFAIGFVLTASVRLLPRFLKTARASFPEASFQVATGLSQNLIADVASGRLDAAVVTGGGPIPAAVSAHTLIEEPMVYCVPTAAQRWPIARCFSELSFIHFMPDAGIGRLIAEYLARSGLQPSRTIVLDSVEAVLECTAAGVGFSILPEPDVTRLAGDHLKRRSLGGERLVRELALVTGRDTTAGRQAAAIANAVVGRPPPQR
ncbi:MAG: LysR substrate-binding domain-containing protein, partial [Pseudomonadota bacterium]